MTTQPASTGKSFFPKVITDDTKMVHERFQLLLL